MKLMPWRQNRRPNELTESPRGTGIEEVHRELDRAIQRFFENFNADPWDLVPGAGGEWAPALDVSETDKEIVVTAEIPGVDPERIDVSVSGDVLTISGSKEESSEEKGKHFVRSERRFGSFTRRLALGEAIDEGKVKAEYRNGVLTVRLPRNAEGSGRRRVPVSVAGK